jgi:hypothetical protein
MTIGGPQFEFCFARRSQLQQGIVAAIVEIDAGDDLGVAAVQTFREPDNRRQDADGAPQRARQLAKSLVFAFRRRTAVIPREESQHVDLLRFEAAQIAVLDEIVRVFVMAFVADVDADVVQERAELEPFAFAVGQRVDGARLVEQHQREPRDLLGVFRPVVAAFGKLEDAAAADVGEAIGLGDFLAVLCNVIEDQPLAQRQIAERQFVGFEPAQDFVQEDGTGHGQIGAAGIEPRDPQSLLDVEAGQRAADATELFDGNAAIADGPGAGATVGCRGGHGAEAENRAGRADHAIEAGASDVVEVLAEFCVDLAHQFALVARRDGVGFDESLREPDDAEPEAPADVDIRADAARDFDAAAADVDDDHRLARRAGPVGSRKVNEARLFRTGNHPRANAGLFGDGAQELAAILRLARGAGRCREDPVDRVGLSQAPELGQHLQSGVYRLGSQRLPVQAAGAQPHHFFFAVDDLE